MSELNILTYNGTSLIREGVYAFPDFSNMESPEKDQSTAEVPGRNGSLILKNQRYKNQTIGYHIISYAGIEYYEWVKGLFLYDSGYGRIEDSVDPNVYRMARCTSVSPADVYPDVIKFAISFDAKPGRYLKSGEFAIPVKSGTKLYNGTMFDALPTITVTGSGTLTVGNRSYRCAQSMVIDSDAQDCYGSNGENLNSQLTLNDAEFPVLKPGYTGITYTGFSKVLVKPNWWRI